MFDTLLYEPIFNALLFVQKTLPGHDLGWAIIIITIVVKAILYVPSLSAIRASRQLQSIQPRLKALQQQYKDNREQLAREQMKLYRENKVNPAAACITPLLQLPILIALYRVFFNGLHLDPGGHLVADQLKHVYPAFVDYFRATSINTMFLGFIDVAKTHNVVLAILSAAATFWQTQMLATPPEPKTPEAKDESMASTLNKQSRYMFPIITLVFSYQFAAGLALYWLVSTLFTVGQQYIFLRQHPLPKPAIEPPKP